MSELYSSILERAIRLAAKSHRTQTRKGTQIPYITHPSAVMLILQRAGFDDERLLAAAVLHDAVEDTDCTFEMLEAEFPPETVGWVRETSERKEGEGGTPRPWIDRKREHLAHAALASPPARAIILADKLHNLYSILFDLERGESIWERFNAPPEHLLWYHQAMLEAVGGTDPKLQTLRNEAKVLLEELIRTSGFKPVEPE